MKTLLRSWMTGSLPTAESICANEFEMLGERINGCALRAQQSLSLAAPSPGWAAARPIGKNIDWNYGAKKDPKIPWELSRFQFLPTLCRAYEIHHNEKYAQAAKLFISDWITKNHAPKGIVLRRPLHWRVPMEAAIRACNWSLAWLFLRTTPSWADSDFCEKFLNSLEQHGEFIAGNLEYRRGFNTNHLIADFTGLLFLGVLFPQFTKANDWKKIALRGLENEMQNQVYEDGVDFEASIGYHRLVCEFFGYSALLCVKNGIALSPEFLKKLEKMFEFAWHYTKPNGLAPQIGDSDDGRLFIFEDFYAWKPADHTHLFKLASAIFPENKKFTQEPGEKSSTFFEQGGIAIMRKNDFYCIIDCGTNGQNGHAGHAHNDTLSFELSVAGEDFIIDPGTYVYTGDPKMRRHFRSTAMHNTVMIDGKEMNRFRLFTLFSMHNDAIPTATKWETDESHDFLDAQHSGYERLSSPVIHRRTFNFDKKNLALEIDDYFIGKGRHSLQWNFHFAHGVILRQTQHDKIIAAKNNKKIEIRIPAELARHAIIKDDFVSPRYGVKEKAPVLIFKKNILLPQTFNFLFALLTSDL